MKRRTGEAAVRRSGVTLIEVLVVLAILGLILGISGLALATLQPPREAALVRALREARAEAILTGKPLRVVLDSTDRPTAASPDRRSTRPPLHLTALFLPDGRAIGPGLDPLTGAPSNVWP